MARVDVPVVIEAAINGGATKAANPPRDVRWWFDDLRDLALERGGHLRVGLEDHVGAGQPTNAELVGRVVELCAAVGMPVATPDEAAVLLDLPERAA